MYKIIVFTALSPGHLANHYVTTVDPHNKGPVSTVVESAVRETGSQQVSQAVQYSAYHTQDIHYITTIQYSWYERSPCTYSIPIVVVVVAIVASHEASPTSYYSYHHDASEGHGLEATYYSCTASTAPQAAQPPAPRHPPPHQPATQSHHRATVTGQAPSAGGFTPVIPAVL